MGFKVGGIGNTCQGITYRELIQNVYPEQWGDNGSLNIREDGTVWGDMC